MAADGYNDCETEASPYGFDAVSDAGSSIARAAAAVHDGTYGLEITFDDTTAAYGTLNADAVDQTTGVYSFWFDTNSFGLGSYEAMNLANTVDGASALNWGLQVYNDGSNYQIRPTYYDDASVFVGGTFQTITDDYHHVLVIFERSTGAGNDDGWMKFYIDGILQQNWTGHDNDARDWDYVLFGMYWTNAASPSGSFYIDEIYVDPTEKYFCLVAARTITPVGAVVKGAGKPSLAGTVTPAGVLARVVAWYRSLAGTVTPAGAVIKGITKLTFTGLITPTGAIIKGVGKLLAGILTPAGRLLQRIANFFRIWFDASPETVARIDITATADIQLDGSPETTVILER